MVFGSRNRLTCSSIAVILLMLAGSAGATPSLHLGYPTHTGGTQITASIANGTGSFSVSIYNNSMLIDQVTLNSSTTGTCQSASLGYSACVGFADAPLAPGWAGNPTPYYAPLYTTSTSACGNPNPAYYVAFYGAATSLSDNYTFNSTYTLCGVEGPPPLTMQSNSIAQGQGDIISTTETTDQSNYLEIIIDGSMVAAKGTVSQSSPSPVAFNANTLAPGRYTFMSCDTDDNPMPCSQPQVLAVAQPQQTTTTSSTSSTTTSATSSSPTSTPSSTTSPSSSTTSSASTSTSTSTIQGSSSSTSSSTSTASTTTTAGGGGPLNPPSPPPLTTAGRATTTVSSSAPTSTSTTFTIFTTAESQPSTIPGNITINPGAPPNAISANGLSTSTAPAGLIGSFWWLLLLLILLFAIIIAFIYGSRKRKADQDGGTGIDLMTYTKTQP